MGRAVTRKESMGKTLSAKVMRPGGAKFSAEREADYFARKLGRIPGGAFCGVRNRTGMVAPQPQIVQLSNLLAASAEPLGRCPVVNRSPAARSSATKQMSR